jgi:hypothetical protein
MDALQFIYEARRRYRVTGQVCSVLSGWVEPESIVKELEVWCKENPSNTRQAKFLKDWPDTHLDENDVILICPCIINKEHRDVNCELTDCDDCRKEFWSQEVE